MISIVADATQYRCMLGDRGLKATAKVMTTLRVEERRDPLNQMQS